MACHRSERRQDSSLTAEARQRNGGERPAQFRQREGTDAQQFGDGPFDGPEDLSLFDRCITRGLPGSMMPFILGNSYEIVQAPGFVAIRYELIHEARVIPLDGRKHLGTNIHLDMGDARGHWDGDSLVVETTNFTDRSAYRNANARKLRLIERFTRTAPGRIEWTVTVDDLTTWTRPWTFAMPLTMNDREPVLGYACHEGNYSLAHILSGARATERGEPARSNTRELTLPLLPAPFPPFQPSDSLPTSTPVSFARSIDCLMKPGRAGLGNEALDSVQLRPVALADDEATVLLQEAVRAARATSKPSPLCASSARCTVDRERVDSRHSRRAFSSSGAGGMAGERL